MQGLQIIAILFSVSLIYSALIHYRRGEIETSEIVSWLAIWVSVLIVIIFPDLLRRFAQTFLFTRLFDLLVVGGFLLVIVIASRAYLSVRSLEKRLEELVRKDALRSVRKKAPEKSRGKR